MLLNSLFSTLPILAQATVGESAAKITQDGAAASQAIAAAMDGLWDDVLGSGQAGGTGLYGAIAQLGIFFGVGTLLIWCVQWFKALIDGETPGAFSEIIWPIVVVVLLSNHASLLATSTRELRDIINQTNQTVLQSTSNSIRLEEAYRQVMTELGAEDAARSLVSQCATLVDPQQLEDCLNNATAQAQQMAGSLQNQPSNGFQKFLDSLNVGKQVSQFLQTNVFQMAVRGWLIAFGIAFQWIVEISLLLTALLGPLAVGGSLLPVGQKAIFAWLTGFFSVGMVKLSFNIISGLVATLVLNAGSNDPMIFAFATGLLAPILSLAIAAGGGMAVFNSLASIAQFGLSSVLPRAMKGL